VEIVNASKILEGVCRQILNTTASNAISYSVADTVIDPTNAAESAMSRCGVSPVFVPEGEPICRRVGNTIVDFKSVCTARV
jgi:hypothetical protein